MSECWYQERWYDQDLEVALEESGISATEENVKKLKAACKNIFDDKSERNTMIKQVAAEIFNI